MQYEKMPPIDHDEAVEIFKSGTIDEIATTLVRVAFHDPDWRWVEKMCLEFLVSDKKDTHEAAVVCLGHIARIHGVISYDVVIPILTSLFEDKTNKLSGTAGDALQDIEMFAM